MPCAIIFLPKAEKDLLKLDDKTYGQIEEHVEELIENPYTCRPHADIIKKLSGFKSPAMYRMRVRQQRLEYFVDESKMVIYVTKAFQRSGDSDYLDLGSKARFCTSNPYPSSQIFCICMVRRARAHVGEPIPGRRRTRMQCNSDKLTPLKNPQMAKHNYF